MKLEDNNKIINYTATYAQIPDNNQQSSYNSLPPTYEELLNYNNNPPEYPQDNNIPFKTKIDIIANKYDIREDYTKSLYYLENINLSIIIDDSGSMSEISDKKNNLTRFCEVKQNMEKIIEIYNYLTNKSINFYFLNTANIFNITNYNQIKNRFNAKPSGRTPLCEKLNEVLDYTKNINNKNLILIFTDGEPSDEKYTNHFKNILDNKSNNTYINIIACTDNDDVVEYLNYLDKNCNNVDVSDDFNSELSEIKSKNKNEKFNKTDYLVKCIVGSLDYNLDKKDGY